MTEKTLLILFVCLGTIKVSNSASSAARPLGNPWRRSHTPDDYDATWWSPTPDDYGARWATEPTVHRVTWASEPPDRSVFYACAQGTISLPWTLQLSHGDVLETVLWLAQRPSFSSSPEEEEEELVAVEVKGHFLPMGNFSGRVSNCTNAGLTMQGVQNSDSGNYSVEALIRSAGEIVSLSRTAIVHVSDDLQTTDGELHARQLPFAEYSKATKQHHVVLTCGTFTYPSQPAFEATWQTPSGNTLASSGYRDNHFYLLLPNPVEDGVFSCHVPAVQACIHDNSSTNASVTVDKMDARFAVMDSEVRYLKGKLECENTAVSFHARLMDPVFELYQNSRLPFPEVVTNRGKGYDLTTSMFTAPYNATYYFLATCEPSSTTSIALMTDNAELAQAVADGVYAYSSAMSTITVHSLTRLTQGQRVWVEVTGPSSSSFKGRSTSFSGFLIDIEC